MSLDAVKRVMEVEKQASQQREEGEREARRRITAAEKAGAERLESACRAAEIKVKKMMTEEEEKNAKETAEREGVDVRLYRVIYNAIEDVEAAMKGMLDPVFEEKVLGHAEVRQTFKASGVGTIAGSYVLDGLFERDCSVRLTRDGIVIFEGPLASLKRFKDDVKEVKAGYECGFVFANFNDIKEGDLVEAFKMVEVPR
jgi:translation initiation factor IF-2